MAATTCTALQVLLAEREAAEQARLAALFKRLGLRTLEREGPPPPWWRTALSGLLLLLVGLAFFGLTLYTVLLAKLLPPPSPSTHPWLAFAHADRYYCLLLPWTLPPAVVLLYLRWLGLEFYRSN